jgi:hypothetical protein
MTTAGARNTRIWMGNGFRNVLACIGVLPKRKVRPGGEVVFPHRRGFKLRSKLSY